MAKKKKSGKKAPQSPNDRFFRGYMSIPAHLRGLLRWQLPETIQKPLNWRTMKVRSTTFVDERLRMRESDLLVEFQTKGDNQIFVYVLWEHQTKVDPLMAWRILCYRVEIWKLWMNENPKAKSLPPIHAMVLYQGKREWSAATDFEQLIQQEENAPLSDQKLSSEFGVFSVFGMEQDALPDDLSLRLGLSLMKAVTLKTQSSWLIDHGQELNEILNRPGGNTIFQLVFEYIYITDAEEKVIKALQQTPPEIEKQAMSFAETLEKRGITRGKQQAVEELVTAMLKNGASVQEIIRLTGLDISTVEAIEKDLKPS